MNHPSDVRDKLSSISRRRFGGGLASMVAAPLLLPGKARAQTALKLTMVAGHPEIFLWVKHLKQTFAAAVDAELAKGGKFKIDWTHAYGGTLAKVGGELEAIQDGLADLGYNPSLFNPAKLPMQNVSFVAPFTSDKPRLVTEVVEQLQRDIAPMGAAWDRFNQTYLGGGITIDSYHLFTTFPVRTLADLNGRKIGAPGPVVGWLRGTGLVGVAGDLTTYYNSIKTGVYDGVVLFATAAAPAKIVEVAPHVTRVNFGSAYAGGLTANKDRWAKLPPEVQAAIRSAAPAYHAAFYREQDAVVDAAWAAMRAAGAQVVDLSAEDRAKWAAGLPATPKLWADNLEKQKLPGHRILAGYMDGMRARGERPPRAWDKE
jgi:TRAP-type C4-dicarboxylate transport system substrate-binding protein